ncbi:hypothetical protein C8R46DRAFT_1186850 [Mycena filopes]|nr:hypothetical protein C8R46DRAFT_1186850 [Mycena filopes]
MFGSVLSRVTPRVLLFHRHCRSLLPLSTPSLPPNSTPLWKQHPKTRSKPIFGAVCPLNTSSTAKYVIFWVFTNTAAHGAGQASTISSDSPEPMYSIYRRLLNHLYSCDRLNPRKPTTSTKQSPRSRLETLDDEHRTRRTASAKKVQPHRPVSPCPLVHFHCAALDRHAGLTGNIHHPSTCGCSRHPPAPSSLDMGADSSIGSSGASSKAAAPVQVLTVFGVCTLIQSPDHNTDADLRNPPPISRRGDVAAPHRSPNSGKLCNLPLGVDAMHVVSKVFVSLSTIISRNSSRAWIKLRTQASESTASDRSKRRLSNLPYHHPCAHVSTTRRRYGVDFNGPSERWQSTTLADESSGVTGVFVLVPLRYPRKENNHGKCNQIIALTVLRPEPHLNQRISTPCSLLRYDSDMPLGRCSPSLSCDLPDDESPQSPESDTPASRPLPQQSQPTLFVVSTKLANGVTDASGATPAVSNGRRDEPVTTGRPTQLRFELRFQDPLWAARRRGGAE